MLELTYEDEWKLTRERDRDWDMCMCLGWAIQKPSR